MNQGARTAAVVWVFLTFTACSNTGNAGGGPPVAQGSQLPPEPDELGTERVPGTCQPLCCSSSQCGGGQVCRPFNSAYGTLGVCEAAAEGEVPREAPGTVNAPSQSLSASCWSKNEAECSPFTNAGCDAGDACDYGASADPGFEPVVACFGGDNVQGPGEACDVEAGPWCAAGLHCLADKSDPPGTTEPPDLSEPTP